MSAWREGAGQTLTTNVRGSELEVEDVVIRISDAPIFSSPVFLSRHAGCFVSVIHFHFCPPPLTCEFSGRNRSSTECIVSFEYMNIHVCIGPPSLHSPIVFLTLCPTRCHSAGVVKQSRGLTLHTLALYDSLVEL